MPRKRLFPPRRPAEVGLRNKGRQAVSHDTVNGSIQIRRTRWWSAQGGTDSRIDQMLGIVDATVSVGVRQMCCRVGIHQQGFVKAAAHLNALAQLRISPERVRRIAQAEGRKVQTIQTAGRVRSDLSVETGRIQASGPSRVYVGADGVKVPMVPRQEKTKRRQRRRRRRAGGVVRRMHRGADNAYKEFKIATLYDESNTHRLVVGTAGDHQVLGRLLRRQAATIGLDRFDQKLAVADGADWIERQLQVRLPMLDEQVLDFYHFSEHVWQAVKDCFGLGTEKAQSFGQTLLHAAYHEGIAEVLLLLGQERRRHRAGSRRRQALEGLLRYLTKRASHCEYPRYLAAGYQIGSGPTEAMCKVLTYRLKGPGMRWDKEGAEPMMPLLALEQSNAWESYWQSQYRAAQPCQKN